MSRLTNEYTPDFDEIERTKYTIKDVKRDAGTLDESLQFEDSIFTEGVISFDQAAKEGYVIYDNGQDF